MRMHKRFGPLLVLGLLGPLAGCNTIDGFGQDIAALGRTLSGSAEDAGGSSDEQQTAEQAASEQQRAAAD